MPTEPEWSDAWLLMALVYGNGSLRETIAFADAVNHAIPTPQEWAHACAVLAPRGLIEEASPLPRPTAAGNAMARSYRAWHTSFEAIVGRMKTMPLVSDDPVVPPTETNLNAGFAEHHAWFEERTKKR